MATARPHLRERLCELLWDAPDDPRASLRWSLAKVRPLVDEKGVTRLVGDRDELVFEPHGATIDWVVLRDELAAGPAVASIDSLRRAAASFRGDFLEGLDLTGCYRYHEWWIAERERVRATRVSVLGQLIERVRDTPDEALEYARQLLALDPLSEASHIRLIRLLGDMGRTREAIAQYDRCKRVLASELGAQPSPELQLARMNLSGSRSAEPVGSTRAPPPNHCRAIARLHRSIDTRTGALPFVGRVRELGIARELRASGDTRIRARRSRDCRRARDREDRAHGGALAAGCGRWRRGPHGTGLRGRNGSTLWSLDRRLAIGRPSGAPQRAQGRSASAASRSSTRRRRSPEIATGSSMRSRKLLTSLAPPHSGGGGDSGRRAVVRRGVGGAAAFRSSRALALARSLRVRRAPCGARRQSGGSPALAIARPASTV